MTDGPKGFHGPLGYYALPPGKTPKEEYAKHLETCNQCRYAEGLPLVPGGNTLEEIEAFIASFDARTALKPVVTDQDVFAKGIHVMTCHECKGKGGFSDTTYDRTGEWRTCGECLGYGKEFSKRAVYRLLGLEKVKPRD